MTIPTPRNLDVDLAVVPRHWLAGSAAATAIANGVNMLFPHGERFFVRSVNAFVDQIDNEELRAQIKGFFGQEGRHAHAHDRFNDVMRAQGFEIDEFLGSYQRIVTWLEEHMPAKLNLAVTAACEHFTAILAEGTFRDGLIDAFDPRVQQLIAWHAAEEIEHKAVAFDVLTAIDPSYALRVAGLMFATVSLCSFWIVATTMLLRQDKLSLWAARRELRKLRALGERSGLPTREPITRRVFARGIRQYLRRDFHPSHNANEHLAAQWFVAHGLCYNEAA